ncbi:hypothetical protein TNCV_3996151 [Trichonephila clavipes]|nr:hypothetical protein TNCV_3996151 [Trichonephila clavipes]
MSSFLVLSEGYTSNRWRDGQVCPDVGQGTNAPWARRLGRRGKKERRKERERSPPCMEKGLSPEIGVKKTMNAGGVENRID